MQLITRSFYMTPGDEGLPYTPSEIDYALSIKSLRFMREKHLLGLFPLNVTPEIVMVETTSQAIRKDLQEMLSKSEIDEKDHRDVFGAAVKAVAYKEMFSHTIERGDDIDFDTMADIGTFYRQAAENFKSFYGEKAMGDIEKCVATLFTPPSA